jgi:hypothetical protein
MKAVEEIRLYGAKQRYKPGVLSAYEYWQEVKERGLPPGEEEYETVTCVSGAERWDWRLYIVTVDRIRVGVAESLDGETLYLLLVVPSAHKSVREAAEIACARL